MPNKPPAKCGTPSGYNRHLRLKIPICEPCRQAEKDRKEQARVKAAEAAYSSEFEAADTENTALEDHQQALKTLRTTLSTVTTAIDTEADGKTLPGLAKTQRELMTEITARLLAIRKLSSPEETQQEEAAPVKYELKIV